VPDRDAEIVQTTGNLHDQVRDPLFGEPKNIFDKLRYIRQFQRVHPGELEMVNLLESQKLMQNSITVLRRTSGVANRRYAGPGGKVRYTEELKHVATEHARRHDCEHIDH
jgi:hypothetical protein